MNGAMTDQEIILADIKDAINALDGFGDFETAERLTDDIVILKRLWDIEEDIR